MQIQEVSLTITGLAAAARFYRDVLELPVTEQPGQATVTIGSSRLVLEEGDQFAGGHQAPASAARAEQVRSNRQVAGRGQPVGLAPHDVVEPERLMHHHDPRPGALPDGVAQ